MTTPKQHGGARPNSGPKRAGAPKVFVTTLFGTADEARAWRAMTRAEQAAAKERALDALLARRAALEPQGEGEG